MSEITTKQVTRAAIDRFGHQYQIIVAIEELSELQKELTKVLPGIGKREHVIEEMADVEICLQELTEMFNVTAEEKENSIYEKLSRLDRRLRGKQ